MAKSTAQHLAGIVDRAIGRERLLDVALGELLGELAKLDADGLRFKSGPVADAMKRAETTLEITREQRTKDVRP